MTYSHHLLCAAYNFKNNALEPNFEGLGREVKEYKVMASHRSPYRWRGDYAD